MNGPDRRSRDVNDAVAERVPVAAGASAETFEALYERTHRKVYAYVASLAGRPSRPTSPTRRQSPPRTTPRARSGARPCAPPWRS